MAYSQANTDVEEGGRELGSHASTKLGTEAYAGGEPYIK